MKLVVCVLCVMATDRTATVSQINPNFVVVFFVVFCYVVLCARRFI